jgi:hypothetical protein
MTELWESTFAEKQMMLGTEPSRVGGVCAGLLRARGCEGDPHSGYRVQPEREAVSRAWDVRDGDRISETAIGLARTGMGLDIPIHHGSVTDMPFDARRYDGVFSFGLLYLLDSAARAKFLRDCCHGLLRRGGAMIFTVVSLGGHLKSGH